MNQKKVPENINEFVTRKQIIENSKNQKNNRLPMKRVVESRNSQLSIQQTSKIRHQKSQSQVNQRERVFGKQMRNPSLTGTNFRVHGKSSSSKLLSRDRISEKPERALKSRGSRDDFLKSKLNSRNSESQLVIEENSKKSIPQQIMDYIKAREDVEIVKFFEEYKQQFYTKSKILHDYLYGSEQPEKIKKLYLNEQDIHFINGMEAVMLKLFRNGTIVPQSYNNLRKQAIQQIQKWVIGWIHRKINYGNLIDKETAQISNVCSVLNQMAELKNQIYSQDTSF